MDNIAIEKMNTHHLESISNILESEFDNFWNYNILKKELNNKNSYYVVGLRNDEIVGFAGISVILDIADITNIVVKKSFRGNGISSILLQNLIDIAKSKNCFQINLEVNSSNLVAINLYKKFEFVQVGLRKGYYNGNDAILLSLPIQR